MSLTEASKHLLIQITPHRVGRAEPSLRSFLTWAEDTFVRSTTFTKIELPSKGSSTFTAQFCSLVLLVKSNFTGWPVSDFPRSHCLPCDLTGQNHQAFVSAHVESIVLGISGFQPQGYTHKYTCIHENKIPRERQIQRLTEFIYSMSMLPLPNASTRVFFLPQSNDAILFLSKAQTPPTPKKQPHVHFFFLRPSGAAIIIGRLSKTTSLSS